jgi:hypothetical protein
VAERPVTNANRSEFEGGGVMPNTVFPKGTEALTASDRLRLQSLTGQEEDSRAPVDPYFWQGGTRPNLKAQEAVVRSRDQAISERLADRDRYKETDLPY